MPGMPPGPDIRRGLVWLWHSTASLRQSVTFIDFLSGASETAGTDDGAAAG